jgi:hypothetical protein
MRPNATDLDRAVEALQLACGDRATVIGHPTSRTVELRGGGRIRVHFMLTSESAATFCRRVCIHEPECDSELLEQQLGVR